MANEELILIADKNHEVNLAIILEEVVELELSGDSQDIVWTIEVQQ
jgi:hypothetical protein